MISPPCWSRGPPLLQAGLLLALSCVSLTRSGGEGIGSLDASDAARTVVVVLVQGTKGCDEFPSWLQWYINSTSSMPLLGLDVVVLDGTAKECVTSVNEQHPGFLRWVQDMSIPEYQNLYQYMIWVVLEQRLRAGEHVLHFDSDALILGDLWPHYLSLGELTTAEVIGTCDCAGPGCKEYGCSFNPAVLLLRRTPGSLLLVQEMLDRWDRESWLDPTTHQMAHKWLTKAISHTHELADMTVLNVWLIQQNCSKRPVGDKRTKASLWSCGKVTLATFSRGYQRGGKPCQGSRTPLSTACRETGLVISHSHSPLVDTFRREAPAFPAPPTGARPAPLYPGSRPPSQAGALAEAPPVSGRAGAPAQASWAVAGPPAAETPRPLAPRAPGAAAGPAPASPPAAPGAAEPPRAGAAAAAGGLPGGLAAGAAGAAPLPSAVAAAVVLAAPLVQEPCWRVGVFAAGLAIGGALAGTIAVLAGAGPGGRVAAF